MLAAVLDEGAPAAADVEHPCSRAHADRVERVVELAGDAVLERLVRVLEDALGVGAVPAVEEGQEEVGVVLVVVLDVVVVAADLPAQERADELGGVLHRVPVGEDGAQREQLGEVTFGVEVAVEVGLAGANDVEAAERVEPSPVADDERRLRLALPDDGLAAVEHPDRERRRGAGVRVAPADLGDEPVRGRLVPAALQGSWPPHGLVDAHVPHPLDTPVETGQTLPAARKVCKWRRGRGARCPLDQSGEWRAGVGAGPRVVETGTHLDAPPAERRPERARRVPPPGGTTPASTPCGQSSVSALTQRRSRVRLSGPLRPT